MVRPASRYREPVRTMELLKQVTSRNKDEVEAVVFGTSPDDPGYVGLPRDFPFTLAGVLNQRQVARLLNEVDIFLDLSSHQAMGLTALEAMACGAAVVVPRQGGATSFARHAENSLVINTASHRACRQAVQRLIEDHALRQRLQRQALQDVCAFFPERPAYNILEVLYGDSAL
jgi:glycosyltransferase involved in cell wall biosynthesis